MRTLLASAGLALLLALATEPSVSAQEAPAWMKQTLPDQALKAHWDEQLAVMNPTGAWTGKPRTSLAVKKLIEPSVDEELAKKVLRQSLVA